MSTQEQIKVCFTIDLEPDCISYLKGFRGIEEGTPPLLDILEQEQVPATFFTTGQVANLYPKTVEKIVSLGHELGCHGNTHKAFTEMAPEIAEEEIRTSTRILREFGPVTSFRAPFLKFPDAFLTFLDREGYTLDSSQAKYKISYYRSSTHTTGLTRIPVSITSSALRLPRWIREPYLGALASPVVLYVHPWEFVDLRNEKMRFDSRFNTGAIALECIRSILKFFKKKNALFSRMTELAETAAASG